MGFNTDHLTNSLNLNKERYIKELFKFLEYESVSTDESKKSEVTNCAEYLKSHLKQIGATSVRIFETKKHPIVYAEFWTSDDNPTLLIYGHYDVQPEDPIDLWISPPFKPEIREDYIYARGVADDKGQVFCHLKAIELYLNHYGELPVNIKFIIEGEEEIGSPNLETFLTAQESLLGADVCVISDSPMYAKNQPALSCSLRGLAYLELEVTGPKMDLHSGQYGGIVQNPIQALSSIISKLKDEDDVVLIPGFYEDVLPLPEDIKASIQKINVNEGELCDQLGVSELVGLKESTINERKWFQPTLDCNGIVGGFTGEGAKTIIPSKATAKVSMRLVANQDPNKIIRLFKQYVQDITPKGIKIDIIEHHGANPARMDVTSNAFNAAKKAFEKSYKTEVKIIGEGGSIPVVESFQRILGLDTVMLGFNLPDDLIHSPNERFCIDNFIKGIETAICFYYYAGEINDN